MPREVEQGEKLTSADFKGVISQRSCTDVLCAVLIWIMWISMGGIGFYAYQNGDIKLVLYPHDYAGNVCGVEYQGVNMTEFPYLYYVNDFLGGVCVKECPVIEGSVDPYTLLTYDGLYTTQNSKVTSDNISIANYDNTNNTLSCTKTLCYPNTTDPKSAFTSFGINKGHGFAWFALDSYPVLQRCVVKKEAEKALHKVVETENVTVAVADEYGPKEIASQVFPEDKVTAVLDSGYSFMTNLDGDLWTARYYILGFGFGISLVLGFTYCFALRIPGVLSFMVWGSAFLTCAIFFVGGWYAGAFAEEWAAQDPPKYAQEQIDTAKYSSYILYAIGGLLALVYLFMRKRLQLAMGCVIETSKAIIRMPLIVLFPVLQALSLLIFMIFWTACAAATASMGTFDTMTVVTWPITINIRTFQFNDTITYCGWYLLFCFFWSSQFIIALGEITFAMAISKWYFCRDKSKIGNTTLFSSAFASLWYHSGTAAFGSLLIAILKTLRAIFAYLQRKAEEMNNSMAKAILCCLQCCFWCLEKCLRFLNKNAYIQTAIFGTSFCTSAKEAFFLIIRNAARIASITLVSGGVMFVGKVFIMSLTTGLAYITIGQNIEEELHSFIGPLILVAFISWFIADIMFMSVYDMGIATILQCFVADEEMFKIEEMYAEGALKRWVNNHGSESHGLC